jgi:hypothetical protein
VITTPPSEWRAPPQLRGRETLHLGSVPHKIMTGSGVMLSLALRHRSQSGLGIDTPSISVLTWDRPFTAPTVWRSGGGLLVGMLTSLSGKTRSLKFVLRRAAMEHLGSSDLLSSLARRLERSRPRPGGTEPSFLPAAFGRRWRCTGRRKAPIRGIRLF